MSVWLMEVLDEFNSVLLRWTILFLLAQTSPPVLAAVWRCLGEGRGQWSSKAIPLTPQKYTRDGGGPTDWNSSFSSYGSRKRNVVPKRKAKQPYKTVYEPPMNFLNRYTGKCTDSQAQDLFRCTAQEVRKLGGIFCLAEEDLICKPLHKCNSEFKCLCPARTLEICKAHPHIPVPLFLPGEKAYCAQAGS